MSIAKYRAEIIGVTTGGPYMYIIYSGDIATKVVTGVVDVATAIEGVKTDIGALLGAQAVTNVNMEVYAS